MSGLRRVHLVLTKRQAEVLGTYAVGFALADENVKLWSKVVDALKNAEPAQSTKKRK